MLEISESSVIYQAKTELLDLAYEVASIRNYKKPEAQAKIRKGFNIYKALQALDYGVYLSQEQRQKIVYCLIEQAEIQSFPVAPVLGNTTPPTIQVGIQGPAGATGARGEDGGATDFTVIAQTSDAVVDTFAVTDALAARWDYVLYDGSTRRAGSVICDWSSDGSNVSAAAEYSSPGSGNSEGIQFSVNYLTGQIRLIATITSGSWTITGSRYFIPNNGTGTGIINTSLASGAVFVGNASNIATAVVPTGDVTISTAGVTAIGAGVIVNADINASAAIALSKLAALTASKATVTDGSGIITTSATTATELGYVSGVTSSIQAQLDSKIGSVTGAITTVVSSDLTVSKALISNTSGKIAASGTSSTELGYLVGVTSSVQTQITSHNDSTIPYITTGITYQNTAAAGANFGIKSTARNTVKIAGILTGPAAGGFSSLTTYATLPVGYRPSYKIYKPISITQSAASDIIGANIVIDTDGTIKIGTYGGSVFGSLVSIHFDSFEFDK